MVRMSLVAPPPASPRAGRYLLAQGGPDDYWAFHPAPLPPDPPVQVDAELQALSDRANQALGRLDGITMLLPDPDQFIYSFARKEAVLSSQIEGTRSSLSDLLLFEQAGTPSVPREDAEEAANYIAAMDHGLAAIQRPGAPPLSARLLREVHGILLRSGRGAEKAPGELRRSQNWIGGTRPGTARFVPPPWPEVVPAMGALERFLHDDPGPTPVLTKAALAHVQFETIHPFLDGNGRVGRLLITLLLCSQGVMRRPLLYLSLYFKQHRETYYDLLERVRTEGAWEAWLRFFLEGVAEVSESTTEVVRRLVAIVERDRQTIHGLGRGAATAHRVHELATKLVIVSASSVSQGLRSSEPAAYGALKRLEEVGILREVTGRRRGRLYAYDAYLAVLAEGTAPE
jgi:Fic family protein